MNGQRLNIQKMNALETIPTSSSDRLVLNNMSGSLAEAMEDYKHKEEIVRSMFFL